jgi:hypothetical protein
MRRHSVTEPFLVTLPAEQRSSWEPAVTTLGLWCLIFKQGWQQYFPQCWGQGDAIHATFTIRPVYSLGKWYGI